MRHLYKFGVLLAVLLSMTLIADAQEGAPTGAAVQNGQMVITGGATPLVVDHPANKGFLSLAWNPGGTKLAYIYSDPDFQAHIAVTDASGSPPVVLDTGRLEAGFPVSWTPDGQVLFVGGRDLNDVSEPYQSNLMRIAPEAGAAAELIGTFEMGVGCGGGSPLPADWAYWAEAGFGGTALVLQWTDYGILHSSNCGGGGLKLFAPQGGEDTPLFSENFLQPTPDQPQQHVARAVLAADGRTLAAVRSTYDDAGPVNSLVISDLATREAKDVVTAAAPDQLAWLADGSLFYSTRTMAANLLTTLTDPQKQNVAAVLGSVDFELPSNEVSIHHFNPATGEDRVIHSAPAYAIGWMNVTPDGQALLFSQIANLDAWLTAIGDGTLDINADMDGTAQKALVPVTVYRLPLGGGSAAVVGENWAQFRLKP